MASSACSPARPTPDCPANTGAFPIWSGVLETYEEQTFTVPHTKGTSRLDFTSDYQFTGQGSLMHIALLEPDGTYAGYSIPQGLADFERIEVANPPAGHLDGGLLHRAERLHARRAGHERPDPVGCDDP